MAIRLAAVEELTAWAGSADSTLAGLVLDAVSGSAIRIAAPVSAAWTSPDTVPAEVKALVLQVAGRVVTNPSGYSSETTPGYSYTLAGGGQRGVTFTDDERQALLDAAGLIYEPSAGAVSVPLRPIGR